MTERDRYRIGNAVTTHNGALNYERRQNMKNYDQDILEGSGSQNIFHDFQNFSADKVRSEIHERCNSRFLDFKMI